jgi:hypothetical protein
MVGSGTDTLCGPRFRGAWSNRPTRLSGTRDSRDHLLTFIRLQERTSGSAEEREPGRHEPLIALAGTVTAALASWFVEAQRSETLK